MVGLPRLEGVRRAGWIDWSIDNSLHLSVGGVLYGPVEGWDADVGDFGE